MEVGVAGEAKRKDRQGPGRNEERCRLQLLGPANPVACAPAPGEDDGGDQEDAQDVAAPPEGPVVPEGAEPEGRGEPEEPDGRVHRGTDDRAESDQAPDLAHG